MYNRLRHQKFDDDSPKKPAIVIHLRPGARESFKPGKEGLKVKAEKEVPKFYPRPIFKPKKHDFY